MNAVTTPRTSELQHITFLVLGLDKLYPMGCCNSAQGEFLESPLGCQSLTVVVEPGGNVLKHSMDLSGMIVGLFDTVLTSYL